MPPEPGSGSAPRRAGRPPTIFAMGGGGFTMEPENPALDDYVRTLAPAREPRICLLPTAGGDSEDQIRRFHTAFSGKLCEPTPHLPVPAGPAPGAGARPPAGAGHHLRRRRLDDQPARLVAGARARRDPARGVAVGDRARRAQRGVDVLVRVGHHQVRRGAGAGAGARLPAGLELRALRRGAGAAARVPERGRERGDPARLGGRRRRGPAVPRRASGGGGRLAAGRRARTGCGRSRARRSRRSSSPGCSRRPRTRIRPRRWRSRRCGRCTRRGGAGGWTDALAAADDVNGGWAGRPSTPAGSGVGALCTHRRNRSRATFA